MPDGPEKTSSRRKSFAGRRNLLGVLLGAYCGFLIYITQMAIGNQGPALNVVPFRTMIADCVNLRRGFVINFLGNIAAFVPVGLLLCLLFTKLRAWHAAAFSLALSLLIETAQGFQGYRTADVDDLILNTLGGWLGYALYRAWRRGKTDPAVPS